VLLIGFFEGGFRNMINNVRPVEKPEDVQGVKYRVMQNPVYIGMFSSLGGNAVPMAWGETFTAVQQGTIDGLEIPLAVIDQNKYFEVTKYLSLTNHTYSAIGLVVSKRSFDRLPADLKKVIDDNSGQYAATLAGKMWDDQAVVVEDMVKKRGNTITVLDKAEVARWEKATQPVTEAWLKQAKDKGLNGDLDRLPLLTWLMFLKFLDDHEADAESRAVVDAIAGTVSEARFRDAAVLDHVAHQRGAGQRRAAKQVLAADHERLAFLEI